MPCQVVHSECVKVLSRIPITLDFTNIIVRPWRSAAIYTAAERVRGRNAGFEFEANNTGQSGDREPKWPTTLEDTVQDGSITWTAKAISTDSLLKVLSSVTWSAPTGITVSGEAFDSTEQTATAYLQPTAVGTYEVIVWPTFNDTPAHLEGFAISIKAE